LTTISFSPASIAGAGISTMTIAVSRTAALGKQTLTVTGKSGTTSHTATVTLTVTN
jgi:hypothetical protein